MLTIPVQRKSYKTVAQNFKDFPNKGIFISLNAYGRVKLMNTNSSYIDTLAKGDEMFFMDEKIANTSLNEKVQSTHNLILREIEPGEAAEILSKEQSLFTLVGETNDYKLKLVTEDEFISLVANDKMFFRMATVK